MVFRSSYLTVGWVAQQEDSLPSGSNLPQPNAGGEVPVLKSGSCGSSTSARTVGDPEGRSGGK